jgi:hypothetical protein
MGTSAFLSDWSHLVDNRLIENIKNHFESPSCMTLGELSFSYYAQEINTNDGLFENGLYIFKFNDSFYVGKATSCTIIERLAKHFDSRRVGGFNSLLKKLYPIDKLASNYPINQRRMSDGKILILPIDEELLAKRNNISVSTKLVNSLEMDLIIKLRSAFGLDEINASKKSNLSGNFLFE